MDYVIDGPRDAAVGVILAHGANAPMDSDFMNAMTTGLSTAGMMVVRFEFPYMATRRDGSGQRPPPNKIPILIETWQAVLNDFAHVPRLYMGGKSMGARAAVLTADPAVHPNLRGVLCLGYPFHPPGKPITHQRDTRLAPVQAITMPCLIVQGTRDPLGSAKEVSAYGLATNGHITVIWLQDGDHGFTPRKSSGITLAENYAQAIEAMVQFIRTHEDAAPLIDSH